MPSNEYFIPLPVDFPVPALKGAGQPIKQVVTMPAPIPQLVIVPRLVSSKSMEDCIVLVNDLNCTCEEFTYAIAQYLYSKEEDSSTYFLRHGGKFPIHSKYVSLLRTDVQQVANKYFGQHFQVRGEDYDLYGS